jgi:hypothetical protein
MAKNIDILIKQSEVVIRRLKKDNLEFMAVIVKELQGETILLNNQLDNANLEVRRLQDKLKGFSQVRVYATTFKAEDN